MKLFEVRTGVGGPVGGRQVGPCLPGLGFEALLAALAVLARGVVFTLALEVPVLQQALGGVEVTLTPFKREENTQMAKVRCDDIRQKVDLQSHTDKC